MPVILPQIPQSMFSSYDPTYIPGYIGYTSKLRSDRGDIYGNATLQTRDYEPGYGGSSLAKCRENYRSSSDLHLRGIISNIPRENAENWNNKNGYFHPASEKYHLSRMNHTFNGDPKTSSAINAIEEIKYEMTKPEKWMPSETDRQASLQRRLETPKQARGIGGADQVVVFSSKYKNEETKKNFKNDFIQKEHLLSIPVTGHFIPRRQGKQIYRPNSGLLPNYSGYVPGQMFLIGNTWGRSSANALGKLQDQRFQWTSLF